MKTHYLCSLIERDGHAPAALAMTSSALASVVGYARSKSPALLRSRHGERRSALRGHLVLLAFTLCFNFLSAQTPAPDFTDPRDGEKYKTVIMPDGKRWMAENLRYRKGLDNPVFANNTTANTAAALTGKYYCPGPGPLNASAYPASNQADPLACEYWGCLYPWWTAYAQNSGTTAPVYGTLGEQGVCPNGWHLPTDNEWGQMLDSVERFANPAYSFAGANNHIQTTATKTLYGAQAGKLLKDTTRGAYNNNQAYTKLWTTNAAVSLNPLGFGALAAGLRNGNGTYSGNGTQAYFWSSTTNGTLYAYSRILENTQDKVYRDGSTASLRSNALSVRCVEGACKESSKMVLAVVPNPEGCGTEIIRYGFDTIEFSGATKDRIFDYASLSPTILKTGWTYSISYEGLPNNGVSFVSNPTISTTEITLKLQGLSAAANNQTFKIKVSGTNPSYCKLDTQFFEFRLLQNNNISTSILTDDRDGKVYKIALMPDGRWWMTQNLNYQTGLNFRGSNASCATTIYGICGLGDFWCAHGTADLSGCTNDGAIYIWNTAVSTDGKGTWVETSIVSSYGTDRSVKGRGICPKGWHVPSDEEWTTLETSVGGTFKPLTKVGFSGGTDLYCFTIVPTGYRNSDNRTSYLNETRTMFPSSSAPSSTQYWVRDLYSYMRYAFPRTSGGPVRCIKDL